MNSANEYDQAYASLIQLNERYGELKPSAHAWVMEAFNVLSNSMPAPKTLPEPQSSTTLAQMMRETEGLLGQLVDGATDNTRVLALFEARTYLLAAMAAQQ